ncbi:MAG: hypothetical protein EA411_12355 [Saprospirales bacterium]|nr:MAG: hypothetical protein EA411_12355 [Saprospirales bacterium]
MGFTHRFAAAPLQGAMVTDMIINTPLAINKNPVEDENHCVSGDLGLALDGWDKYARPCVSTDI